MSQGCPEYLQLLEDMKQLHLKKTMSEMPLDTLPILGFDGFYRVDRSGNVWTCQGGRWRVTKPWRIMKPTPNAKTGHMEVGLMLNKQRCRRYVHRLVLETFVGPCPESMECRHLDGNSRNNQLTNLCWGTRAENIQDAVSHGTITRGERAYNAKLSDNKVREIRQLYATGDWLHRELAKIYGVSRDTIARVVRKEKWKHVI